MTWSSFPGIMFGSDSTTSFDAIKEVTLQQGLSAETGKRSASRKRPSPEKENQPSVQNFQGDKRAFDRPILQAQQASARDAVEVPKKKLRGIIKNSNDEELLSFLAGNPGDHSQAEERPVKKKVHFNFEEAPESRSTTATPSQSRMMLLQKRSARGQEEKFFEADGELGDETEALVRSFQRLFSGSLITRTRRAKPNSWRRIPLWQRRELLLH